MTLGIPRLREIIMTGNTKLPSMVIPLIPSATKFCFFFFFCRMKELDQNRSDQQESSEK